MSIEAWVTGPAGASDYLAHLDRSEASPLRGFAVSFVLNEPGVGSLEYHLGNALLAANPSLLDDGNLVWMRYRGKTGVWVIEERKVVLDEREHATDWVQVSGRGALQLLGDRIVLPPAFEGGANLDPSTWGLGGWKTKTDAVAASGQPVIPVVSTTEGDGASVGIPTEIAGGGKKQVGIIASIVAGVSVTLEDDLAFTFPKGSRVIGATKQWRRFVNRAAGEMLWDLITETNPFIVARGGAPIVRGIVETTGADGWTQDLKFDNLLEVAAAVTKAYGDVWMDGLTFNYVNALGVDRSSSVILEEGADLTRVERSSSDRDTVSWLVGEGVGEGVFAKLAIAEDATIARPRMAYLDAKDAGNVPLLQLLTDAALAENRPFESTGFEFTEERYRAFEDFDVGDTIRAIAPSRTVDASARIVALYVAEKGDEVVVACDLTSSRPDPLLGLDDRQRSTARSLGVRNRQPQGQLVPYSFGTSGILDSGSPLYGFVKIPDRVDTIVEAKVTLAFRQFLAPATAATSSGQLTSDSGGGATSGPSSASTSALDDIGWTNSSIGHTHGGGPAVDGSLTAITSVDGEHTHGIAHTHSTPNHQHTVPGHGHGLTYGTFEEAFPASHSVTFKLYEREDTTWVLRGTFAGLTEELVDIDLISVMTGSGDWRYTVQSEAAQPNGGRLGCDVFGALEGSIQSA